LSVYADMTDGDEAPLASVIYITGSDDIDGLVRRLAIHADLSAPKLSFRTLDQVIAQTREAARATRDRSRMYDPDPRQRPLGYRHQASFVRCSPSPTSPSTRPTGLI
jgi:hypothetical protein